MVDILPVCIRIGPYGVIWKRDVMVGFKLNLPAHLKKAPISLMPDNYTSKL